METDRYEMLELMTQPAFCVKDGIIQMANHEARAFSLESGMEIFPLLLTGEEEYRDFTGGCLSLQLSIQGIPMDATVTKLADAHVFLMGSGEESGELRALALAARELRQPLSNLIAIADTIRSDGDPKGQDKLARLSRGLYQMERTIGNMSDTGMGGSMFAPEYRDIPAVVEEIFKKAAALLSETGAVLTYTGLNREVYGMIDARQMERSVLNILSNALKFTPSGCEIQASLTQQGSFLRLCIRDNGPGIDSSILPSLFSRYLRQPGLEDSRFGLGLGMLLIRSAALSHGGTLLVDQPEGGGTRITMTMKLLKPTENTVRSPMVVLSGGRDLGLIELSSCLPLSVYEQNL